MLEHGYSEATPVQQKSRNFDPASLTHVYTRTNSNRIDTLKIPDDVFPACHQLWGQPTPHRHAVPVLSLAACDAEMPAMKIDWSSVDWRKPVRQIAEQLGCTRQAVYLAQARRWGGPEKVTKQATPLRRNTLSLKNIIRSRSARAMASQQAPRLPDLRLPRHRIIQEHRDPLPRRNSILFRPALQIEFAIQIFDQLRLTPRSNDLTLVFESRKGFHFHAGNCGGRGMTKTVRP